MAHEISVENLRALISASDPKMLDGIERRIASFESYHRAIVEMESWMMIYKGDLSSDEYTAVFEEKDRARTSAHNAALANLKVLVRMAENVGLPPIYDGVISEEQPYRREAADAMLAFVETLIRERL